MVTGRYRCDQVEGNARGVGRSCRRVGSGHGAVFARGSADGSVGCDWVCRTVRSRGGVPLSTRQAAAVCTCARVCVTGWEGLGGRPCAGDLGLEFWAVLTAVVAVSGLSGGSPVPSLALVRLASMLLISTRPMSFGFLLSLFGPHRLSCTCAVQVQHSSVLRCVLYRRRCI